MPVDPFARVAVRLPDALSDPELLAASRGLDARLRLRCGDAAVDVVAASDGLRAAPPDGEADVMLAAGPAV